MTKETSKGSTLAEALDDARYTYPRGETILGFWRAAADDDDRATDRRLGIGRWLLGIGEQRLCAAGAIRVDAMVLDANPSAHALWSAAGYFPQDSWSRWVSRCPHVPATPGS